MGVKFPMLLTCNRCLNTFFVDDQIYQSQPQNCLCEQCHVPLMPVASPQADPIPGQDWQQPQQPAWQQPQQPAWQQPQQPAWQQPQQPAWQQPQQPAWQQPQQPAWQQDQQPAWQQPQQPAWQQPQQPAWQAPQSNVIEPVVHSDTNEKTMALDLDADAMLGLSGDEIMSSLGGGSPNAGGAAMFGSDAVSSIGETCALAQPECFRSPGLGLDTPAAANPTPTQKDPHVVIGQTTPALSESSTRSFDLSEMPQVDDPNASFIDKKLSRFENIPRLYLIITAAVAAAIIIVILLVIVLLSTDSSEENTQISDTAAVQTEPEKKELTFEQLTEAVRDRLFGLPNLSSDIADSPTSGLVLDASSEFGVLLNNKEIANFDVLDTDLPYIEEIAKALKKDTSSLDDVFLFFDDTTTVDVVYRTLYTVFANQKIGYIAGVDGFSIVPFKFGMYKWPNYGTHEFKNTTTAELKVTIAKDKLTLTKISGDEPLDLGEIANPDEQNPDAPSEVREFSIEFSPNDVKLGKIADILKNYKGASYIVLEAYPSCQLRTLLRVATQVRGPAQKPNFKNIALAAIPHD